MRLTVIGRNPQEANIVLDSQYISNYHAEIIQLDNGDMFLVDKSTNGTFLNGNRLTPGKEVAIKRGDNIMFADMPLNWSMIDEVRVPSDVKQIKSIGSHYMNTISVQGPNVSRFHATIRQMSDGKWYICDHSKNGTTVNGSRLQKNRFVRLKKGDEITCGGVPVQNPIPGNEVPWKWIIGVVAAACLGALVYIGIGERPKKPVEIYQENGQMVAWVSTSYHFEATCSGIDLEGFDLIDKFCIEFDEDGDPDFVAYNGKNSMRSGGTGFFIGDKGHIVTNRHVSRPWEAFLGTMSDGKSMAVEYAEIVYREYLTDYLRKYYPKYYYQHISHISKLTVEGVIDDVYVIRNNTFPDAQNTINCHEVICSSMNEDLALLQIRNNMVAPIKSFSFDAIRTEDLPQGEKIHTIGFPLGLAIQQQKNKLEAYCAEGVISRTIDQFQYGFTAPSYSGASGSPIFDKYGKIVGIVNARVTKSQGFNYAIKSSHLYELLKKANLVK